MCLAYFTKSLQCSAGFGKVKIFQRCLDKACTCAETEFGEIRFGIGEAVSLSSMLLHVLIASLISRSGLLAAEKCTIHRADLVNNFNFLPRSACATADRALEHAI